MAGTKGLMQPIKNIVQLRQFLAERLPNMRVLPAHMGPKRTSCWPTGLPQIDDLLEGGLPTAALTEIVNAKTGSGGALLIFALLRQTCESRQWLALIDGQDCFDPSSVDRGTLSRLLWARCGNANQALKAADLLARDGNGPLIILDLQLNPPAQLQKIPAAAWYRFQRLLESTSSALLVLTPRPMIGCAQARIALRSQFNSIALDQTKAELLANLKVESLRRPYSRTEETGNAAVAQVG